MILVYIQRLLWLFGLVLLQVLFGNNIHLFGYATPFLYVYLVLKMEAGGRNGAMLWAFFLALLVDVFSDTLGISAAATVLLAFARPWLLRLFAPRDVLANVENLSPSFHSLGVAAYIKYVVVAVLLHHAVLLSLEYFSFTDLPDLLVRVLSCSVLTVGCVFALDGIRKR